MKRQPGPGDGRTSRLFVGVLALALLVIAAGLVWFVRSLRRGQGEAPPPAEPVGWAAPTEARPPPPDRSEAPPTRAATTAPQPAPRGGEADGASAARSVGAALRRHDLLLAEHNQQAIREADERAFAQLNVPEHQRVTIRLLNERMARARQELIAAERDDLTPEGQAGTSIAIGDQVARERQTAVKEILGADLYQSFQVTETAEIRRLQRRYRIQWAQELDEQAPLPPGLPPRAH